MRIAFYGSSLVSSYWNGAATYYRGMLKALAARGYDITFYEPDIGDRQSHRDIEPPDWCRVVVYDATVPALQRAAAEAAAADIVIKASGVGFEDERLLVEVMDRARPDALRLFWDMDAPATLAELRDSPDHPLRLVLPELDMVLTHGGGDPVVAGYRTLGAEICVPIYNALDPQTHHPAEPQPRFAADLGFLGNRLPDREARVEDVFLGAAARLPRHKFLLGGAGWQDKAMPPNVNYLGHVGTADHNAFNSTPMAVLNISREGMAQTGFSPATRVFEAAGAGAWPDHRCLARHRALPHPRQRSAGRPRRTGRRRHGREPDARTGRCHWPRRARAGPARAHLCPPGGRGRCAVPRLSPAGQADGRGGRVSLAIAGPRAAERVAGLVAAPHRTQAAPRPLCRAGGSPPS